MIDVNLVVEALYYLFPENEEEDRAYIERTLPILHKKLKLDEPAKHVRHRKWSYAMVAILVILGVLFLASAVAYAFGINVLNFFVYGTDEYWMIHIQPTGGTSISTLSHQGPSENYDVWGEAVADMMSELGMTPQLPKWIPEEYSLTSVRSTNTPNTVSEIYAWYSKSDNEYFRLTLRLFKDTDRSITYYIEKDKEQAQIVYCNDLEILLAKNFEMVNATWITEGVYVHITGTLSMETLLAMIDSMQ